MKTEIVVLFVLVGMKLSTGFPTTSVHPKITKTSNNNGHTTSDEFEDRTINNQIPPCYFLNSIESPEYCPDCPNASGYKVKASTDSAASLLDLSISVESMEITNLCESFISSENPWKFEEKVVTYKIKVEATKYDFFLIQTKNFLNFSMIPFWALWPYKDAYVFEI